METGRHILVTGATGYIGGRLVPRLLAAGYRVRVMARDTGRLQQPSWLDRVAVVEADPLVPDTLPAALEGVHAAYYLIHSMAGGRGFRQRDITAAQNFGRAARNAGVARVVYLGAMGASETDLSEHLRSRQETGDALRETGPAVTEFRAAVVVGTGSISFEMIRYLTERIPVMVCPKWVFTRTQPIAIGDLLSYLVAALERPDTAGRTIEVGGADVLTYAQMMTGYARVRRLHRWLLSVPVLTPRLSSYWVHWVTPISAAYARPLIEGLRNEVVVKDPQAASLFPDIHPVNYETSVRTALDELKAEPWLKTMDETHPLERPQTKAVELVTREGMLAERRRKIIPAPVSTVHRLVSSLGGHRGWLCLNWAWWLRGLIDRMIDGPGLQRTRPARETLQKGDIVDFYRVEAVQPDRLLRYHVQMKLPGEGWLQFEVTPHGVTETTLIQTVLFAPRGLIGLIYWYLFYPAHWVIFSCMLAKLARKAQNEHHGDA